MSRKNNLYYAGLFIGAFYFPFAALFYALSGKCLMYSSNRLYDLLILLRHGDWYAKRLSNTIKYLDMDKDMKVLEVGCGPGKFSKQLIETGAQLKAIDVNEKFICKLQEAHDDTTFELCSVLDLSYKDNLFDRVVMFDVLHHVPDYGTAIAEIYRVLKPGGYALIWEGSDTGGEEKLPPKLADYMMRILDGDTNPVLIDVLKKKYDIEEVEPYCFKLTK